MYHVVIPARYASTRLPAKPLLDLGGKPMVVRVAERALAAAKVSSVCVAADHPEVVACCQQHGIDVVMTDQQHTTGTDRLAEVVRHFGWDDATIVVNVQGDEPLIDPQQIDLVAQTLQQAPHAAIATLAHPITQSADYFNPNIVKVVCQESGEALYFSRATIPFARDHAATMSGQATELPVELAALRHIGLYAYRAQFLKAFTALPPTALERLEALEQLRALGHGYRIQVVTVPQHPSAGVDTPEDARRMQQIFSAGISS